MARDDAANRMGGRYRHRRHAAAGRVAHRGRHAARRHRLLALDHREPHTGSMAG